MVMKKIIAFIICLALCVSAVAVGVMNQQAKNSVGISGAAANAAVGSGVNVTLDNVASGNTGTVGNAYADPSGAESNVGKVDGNNQTANGAIEYDSASNTYYLTGNVSITTGNETNFQNLKNALATPGYTVSTAGPSDADLAKRVTFDGRGYILTTSIPLFDTISGCVVKDLTIKGTIAADASDLYGHDWATTNTDGTADGKIDTYSLGIFADVNLGVTDFTNVLIDADITYSGDTAVSGGVAPFVVSFDRTSTYNRVTLTNCAFTGSIVYSPTDAANPVEVKVGGLFGESRFGQVHITNCTVKPDKIVSAGHFGGAVMDANHSARTVIKNTYAEYNDNVTFLSKTAYCGGFVGQHSTGTDSNGNLLTSDLTIENSRVAGSITIQSTSGVGYFGAFTGFENNGTLSLYKNINSTLSIVSEDTGVEIGGVVGAVAQSNVTVNGFSTSYGEETASISGSMSYAAGVLTIGSSDSYTPNIQIGNVTLDTTITKTSGSNQVGGIVAQTRAPAVIVVGEIDGVAAPVVVNAKISSTIGHLGGVIGAMIKGSLTVKNTTFTKDSSITGGVNGTGGIAGLASGTFTITVMNTTLATTINAGASAAGGLIGSASSSNNLIVDDLDVTSDFAISTTSTVGGLIGTGTFNSISLKNIDFDGRVTTTSSTKLGGLIGGSPTVNGTVTDSTYGIVFENVIVGNVAEFDYTISGDNAFGVFMGWISNAITNGISFKGCVNNANISKSISSSTNTAMSLAGFIARTQGQHYKIDFVDCTNNGSISMETYRAATSGSWGSTAGGFIGYDVGGNTVTFDNCVNTGNIYIKRDSTSDYNAETYAGGFLGRSTATTSTFTDCLNSGDVTVEVLNCNKGARAFGFGDSKSVSYTNCINLGNITCNAPLSTGARVAGYIGMDTAASTFTNCVNAGDISMTASGNQPAAGLASHVTGTDIPFVNCINIGTITSNNTYFGALFRCPESGSAKLTNCYNLNGTIAEDYTFGATGFTTLSDYLKAENVKATGVNNAKAYIALILSEISYLQGTVNESIVASFMAAQLPDVFTVDAKLDASDVCYTRIDKDFYDAVEAIAGDSNVNFDGIVTPSRVATAANDNGYAVTINGLTALQGEGTVQLYMDADRDEQNIGKDFVENGNYKIKIVLVGGYDELDYTARAYIKIGNAYIYSAVAE